MAKAKLKTSVTNASVSDFLESISPEEQRQDALVIDKLMRKATGEAPKMWGTSIIGYGSEQLKYASGRELDWLKIGFSPRKQNISLYVLMGGKEKYTDLLKKLGPHKTGVGCLYIKRLSDIDMEVLEKLIKLALKN